MTDAANAAREFHSGHRCPELEPADFISRRKSSPCAGTLERAGIDGAPVAIYMLRNYFETIPESVEEAGLVDGLNRLGVIRRVSLPLALPSVVATGIFVFMIAWNEFLFALLFLVERRDRWTVSLGLAQLSGSVEIPTTVLMAGSVIITLPVVALFFFTERLLSEGLTSGAAKG
jgi:multiple sugar transport system permease protein